MMKILLGISAILGTLAVGSANAACTQADMTGSWSTNTIGTALGIVTYAHCNLDIMATGLVATTSTCLMSGGGQSKVTGSIHLVRGMNCQYNGSVKFASNGTTANLTLLTMSKNSEVVEGIGTTGIVAPLAPVVFNMIKVD